MHRSLAIALLGLSFIVGGIVAADAAPTGSAVKIGLVDFDRILTETSAGKSADQKFKKELQKKQKELDAKQQELQKQAAQFEKQKSILKPEMRRKKEQELQKRYVELQQTYVKLERELAARRTKLIQEILKKAEPVILQLARTEGYNMIVDRSAVVWSDKKFDLTDKIKQRIK